MKKLDTDITNKINSKKSTGVEETKTSESKPQKTIITLKPTSPPPSKAPSRASSPIKTRSEQIKSNLKTNLKP